MTTITLTASEKIAAAADRHGIWAKDVARFDSMLTEFGLTAEDMTQKNIDGANAIARKDMQTTRRRVEAINRKNGFSEDVSPQAKATTTVRRIKTGKRASIFGHSVTAVLRWMGKEGWSFDDAAVAVETLAEKRFSDTTIRIQLRAGKAGERGAPAPIDSKQRAKLIAASK